MVLDTQTVSSLHDLASVVRDYVSPGRSKVELTNQQKEDGCMMRYLHGWHVHHIVEALGVANSNYSHNWEENMMDALQDCAASDYWNTQRIRLQPDQSPGGQISVAGTNVYGAARQSAVRNAMAGILVADPKARNAPTKDKEGKDIQGTSLAERSFAVILNQIEDGSYRNQRPTRPSRQDLNRYIRDMLALGFVWEGAGRTQIMDALPDDIREAIDAEILRQCRQQLSEGATVTRGTKTRAVTLNYSAIARDIYSNFIIFPEPSKETMASMGYEELQMGYVRQICQDANITANTRRPVADQVKDAANIKLVQDEKKAHPAYSAWQVQARTGLSMAVVEGIFDDLGFPQAGRTYTTGDIRKIILAAHDTEKLTIQEMIEKHPELATHFKDTERSVTEAVRGILSRAGRIPITAVTLEAATTEERRIPLRATQIKSVFLAHLRSRDQVWLDRVRGNLSRLGGRYSESTNYSVEDLAGRLQETPEFIRRAIALLEAETPQIIAIQDEVIVIPRSGLLWLTRGGETVEGEVGR